MRDSIWGTDRAGWGLPRVLNSVSPALTGPSLPVPLAISPLLSPSSLPRGVTHQRSVPHLRAQDLGLALDSNSLWLPRSSLLEALPRWGAR